MVPRPISAGVSVYGALLMHRSLSGSAFSRSPMLARSRKRAASASSSFIRHSPNRRYLTDCPHKRSFAETTRATSNTCATSADAAALDSPRYASRSGGGSAARYPKGRSSAQRLTGHYPAPRLRVSTLLGLQNTVEPYLRWEYAFSGIPQGLHKRLTVSYGLERGL